MNIALETIDVWEIEGDFAAKDFFPALQQICFESDIIVIGAYNPNKEVEQWLRIREELISKNGRTPFSDECFQVNRREYPRGHAYAVRSKLDNLIQMAEIAQMKNGGTDKDLFFDHILAYRPDEPVLPLFDFHDSFTGGTLVLSGHFAESIVHGFAKSLRTEASRVRNRVLLTT